MMAIVIKKLKRPKMCNKKIPKFNYYKKCLLDHKTILKLQQWFKSKSYNMYTEEINKISLSSNNDERLQTFDKITSYPYGANVGKVYQTKLFNIVFNIK